MKELIDLISEAKEENPNSMLEIIKLFDPIISKYSRAANWDEDIRSELIVFLIEITHKIDPDSFRSKNDYAVLKYISKSIAHKYIHLNRSRASVLQAEKYTDKNYEVADACNCLYDDLHLLLFEAAIRPILTEKEYNCIVMIFLYGYKPIDAAKAMGVSRQTIHETKNRALDKLKESNTLFI